MSRSSCRRRSSCWRFSAPRPSGSPARVLLPFRAVFLEERRGWLWGLLLGLCILSTAGPAPGSVEGLIYTRVPWTAQLLGLPETVAQTLAFSYLLVAWHHRPGRAWGIAMGTVLVLVVLAAIGGTLAGAMNHSTPS